MQAIAIERDITETAAINVETKRFALGAFPTLCEEGAAMQRLLAEWKNPTAEQLATLQTVAPDYLFHIVDTTAHDPNGFYFKQFDDRALIASQTGKYLAEVDAPEEFRTHVRKDYDTVRTLESDSLSVVKWSSNSGGSQFIRLSHSFDNGGKVLVAVRYKEFFFKPRLVDHLSSAYRLHKDRFANACRRERRFSIQAKIGSGMAIELRGKIALGDILEGVGCNPVALLTDSDFPTQSSYSPR